VSTEVNYDGERGLLYVQLRDPPGSIERTEDFGRDRYVDYDEAGNVVGVEFLAIAQDGLNLDGLPEVEQIISVLNSVPRPVISAA
jgi:YD repeat-containing protein